jgi:hypothetical protein
VKPDGPERKRHSLSAFQGNYKHTRRVPCLDTCSAWHIPEQIHVRNHKLDIKIVENYRQMSETSRIFIDFLLFGFNGY